MAANVLDEDDLLKPPQQLGAPKEDFVGSRPQLSPNLLDINDNGTSALGFSPSPEAAPPEARTQERFTAQGGGAKIGGTNALLDFADPKPALATAPLTIEPSEPVIADSGSEVTEVKQEPLVIEPPEPVIAEPEVDIPEPPKFTYTNPLTGEVEEFDTVEKRQKREKDVAAQIIDQEAQDVLKTGANDLTTISNKVIADIMNPETPDPIKTAAVNEAVAMFGPENQAATDSLMAQLKADNLDGTGAGNAMMLLLARGNQAQFSNVMQRLNTESAQRVFDMNKFGADLGLRIRQQVKNEEQQKFSNDGLLFATAVEAGDWTAAGSIASDLGIPNLDTTKLEQMDDVERAAFISSKLAEIGFPSEGAEAFSEITGYDIDASTITNPAIAEIVSNRLEAIKQIQDPEAKKAAMLALAEEFPETFGFPNDPEAAKAAVENMDFTNIEDVQLKQKGAMEFWRQEAITDEPNLAGVISHGTDFWNNFTEAQIDANFTTTANGWEALSDETKDVILDGLSELGISDLSEIDTREEKEAFLSLKKFTDQRKEVGSITGEIFDELGAIYAGTDLASWFDGTSTTKSDIARTWIADNIVVGGNFSTDENGNLVLDLEDVAKPWNENAAQYNFMTWPRKTFDEDGNVISVDYTGQEFRDDMEAGSVQSEPASIAEDQQLTNAYVQYHKENPDGLNWLDWYDESQGGTKEIDKPFDPVTAREDFIEGSLTAFETAIETGGFSAMSNDEWFTVLDENPEAKTLLEKSEIQQISTAGLGDVELKSDFDASGLKADVVKIENSSMETEFLGGEGEGKGSVVLFEGRPVRITNFNSLYSEGNTLTGRPDRRLPSIIGVYLDVQPPEVVTIYQDEFKKGPLS